MSTFAMSARVFMKYLCNGNTGALTAISLIFYLLIFTAVYLISFRYIGILDNEIYGGIDSLYYKEVYDLARTEFLDSLLLQSYEPGFGALVWLFSSSGFGYEYYQICIYFFLFYSLHKIVKKSVINIYTPMIIFLGLLLILGSDNLLRIVLASVIFYYSFFYFIAGRNFLSVLLSIVAVTIHVSSLIPILALLFIKITENTKGIKYFCLYTLAFIFIYIFSFFYLSNYIGDTKYSVYIDDDGSYSLNTYFFAAFILLIYKYRFSYAADKNFIMMINFISTLFLTLPIYLAFPIGYRFLLFYLPAIYFILPLFLKQYSMFSWGNIVNIPIYISLLLFICLKIYFTYRDDFVNWGVYYYGSP